MIVTKSETILSLKNYLLQSSCALGSSFRQTLSFESQHPPLSRQESFGPIKIETTMAASTTTPIRTKFLRDLNILIRKSIGSRKLISQILLAYLLCGCSSLSSRNKIYRDMAIGAAVGAALAQTKSENRNAYTTMYAGIGAASAGIISVYLNSDDKIKSENESLKARLDLLQKKLEPELIQKGSSLFSSPLPKEVSSLVDPGEWKRYKMDQWVSDPNQPNTWYRQVEMFEISPPVSK